MTNSGQQESQTGVPLQCQMSPSPHILVWDDQPARRRLISAPLVGSSCDEGSDRCAYELRQRKIIGK